MDHCTLIRSALAAAVVLALCGCEELPIEREPWSTAVWEPPMPTSVPGWWDDYGASGAVKIVVHISQQKAYFHKGNHLVGFSSVSTGKPGFSTPPGHYKVESKSPNHVSTLFGNYVDQWGNIVRFNIDSRKDRPPPGTRFDGASMPYAMFFRGGYAIHRGYVPPYADSHGCIRLPKGMAERFYDAAPIGTPVIVKP